MKHLLIAALKVIAREPKQLDQMLDLGLPSSIVKNLKDIHIKFKSLPSKDQKWLSTKGYKLLIDWFQGEWMTKTNLPTKQLIRAFNLCEKIAADPPLSKKVWRVIRVKEFKPNTKKIKPGNKPLTSWSQSKEGAVMFYEDVLGAGHGEDQTFVLISAKPINVVGEYISVLMTVQMLMAHEEVPYNENDLMHMWSMASQEEIIMNVGQKVINILSSEVLQ